MTLVHHIKSGGDCKDIGFLFFFFFLGTFVYCPIFIFQPKSKIFPRMAGTPRNDLDPVWWSGLTTCF